MRELAAETGSNHGWKAFGVSCGDSVREMVGNLDQY